MKRYVKKPIVVEAEQWFYVNYDREAGHGNSSAHAPIYHLEVGYYRHPDVDGEKECEHCGNTMHNHGFMDTLEGGHTVCPGDYIIRGIAGEMYPCKPEIFKASYDDYEMTADDVSKILVKKAIENEELDTEPVEEQGINPAHFCFGCDKYIGHWGFCSTKCHNEYYDAEVEYLNAELETAEILSDDDCMAGIRESMKQINNGKGIPLYELYPEKPKKHFLVDDVNPIEDTFKWRPPWLI